MWLQIDHACRQQDFHFEPARKLASKGTHDARGLLGSRPRLCWQLASLWILASSSTAWQRPLHLSVITAAVSFESSL